MKNKVVNVDPYIEIYKVIDKRTNDIVVESTSIYDLYLFIMSETSTFPYGRNRISYTLKKEADTLHFRGSFSNREYIKYPPANYVIVDHYRNAIGEERIREERIANYVNKRKPEKLDYGKYLVRVADDTRKIKSTYRTYKYVWHSAYYNEARVYYSLAEQRGYYRRPRTMSERKAACGHIDEYGEVLVRAKRNHKNLPNSYDDLPSDIYGTMKSWKHNSKRRKQWK